MTIDTINNQDYKLLLFDFQVHSELKTVVLQILCVLSSIEAQLSKGEEFVTRANTSSTVSRFIIFNCIHYHVMSRALVYQ